MRILVAIVCVIGVMTAAMYGAEPQIELEVNNNQAIRITNRTTQSQWLAEPTSLYEVTSPGALDVELDMRPTADGQLRLWLTVTNTNDEPIQAAVTFPVLRHLAPDGDGAALGYCFPRINAAISDRPTQLRSEYGGRFPLQFISVHHPQAGGVYLLVEDTAMNDKTYWLNKADAVAMGVDHRPRTLKPGETWTLPPVVIAAHEGDWHAAFEAYRNWVRTWHQPTSPRKAWFREVFNFRQVFLHHNLGAPGAFDPESKQYRLSEYLDVDVQTFGSVEYVHIFDWAKDAKRGRVGDYNAFDQIGGLEAFRQQIAALQADDKPVGLYLEGYLVAKASDAGKAHGEAWQMLASNGMPYGNYGPGYWTVCPHVPAWQDHLIASATRAAAQTDANGIYIDQFGFGWHYACYNPEHDHPVPSSQIQGEATLIRRLRETLPADVVLYTEETPCDVATQYQDGSFTYAIASARNELSPSRLNLTRFALPDFKMFEIIRCDMPLGDDQLAVKHIFFNGNGIWIEGPLIDAQEEWFSPAVLELIRRTNRILRAHRDAFLSTNPQPLVRTEHPQLHANCFPGSHETVWTLYNTGPQPLRGELLRVPHVEGASYVDAWHDRPIEPRVIDGYAVFTLDMTGYDAGCIVQRRPVE